MEGKIIILSAPSGCGKSSIIGRIMEAGKIDIQLSVSATNRPPRPGEVDGVHYNFITTEEFEEHIRANDFVEYEEVYAGRYYGTLKSEIERICSEGHYCVLDIDVKGALNVKRLYGGRAISIFVMPPSVDELRRRLELRGTETQEWIDKRVGKAAWEMEFAPKFDFTVVNDDLDKAVAEISDIINR
ncbi:MAG: guanylate kinase [Lachnoclostridium sp.]|nr:guanylate kinase [Lachnoclostridium sp.]